MIEHRLKIKQFYRRNKVYLTRQVLADAQAALNAANTEVERAEAQIAIEV